ncbi:MAG TPA: aldo/keto reductase [Thermodesulfobacteriota bacterium]|nr:aldo/keto reductase [Thermodesulfobacteriota bacterium]
MALAGSATAAGTARYRDRLAPAVAEGHFREAPGLEGLVLSSIGLGSYLGEESDEADAQYRAATRRALALGANVLDAAINYRCQRSERALGAGLADAIAAGEVARDEVVVATKGGFLSFDGAPPADPAADFERRYVRTGIATFDDIVAGCHIMTPRYLRHELDASRRNFGLETLDIYYVHNPETQLPVVGRAEFERRLTAAFAALEQAVADGAIRWYGTATWNAYRQPRGARDYLALEQVLACARAAAGGDRHHFRVIQLPYNLAMPEALVRENQPVGRETTSILVAAAHYGLTVMASASIYQSNLARRLPPFVAQSLPGLATDAQRAIQFVRSTPGVTTALVGMKQVAHVEENLAVARVPPATQAQLASLLRGGK